MMTKKVKMPGEKKFHLVGLNLFENNTFVLIFSFLCAVVVWFAMMGSELEGRGTVISNVPIQVEVAEAAQEAGVRVFSQSYNSTDVSVTGNAMVTSRLTTEDIGVTAALNPSLSMLTGSSMQEATLSLRAYKKGNTLADYEVEGVTPSEITVVYDKYKEMQLSIQNKVQYSAAEGYYAAAAPSFSANLVTISGPESQVNRVDSAALAYTFTDELTQTTSISCKITLFDVNGEPIDPAESYITLSDNTVDVSIAVTGRQTVTLQPDIRNMPESFSAKRMTISPETIEIAGDSEIISGYETLNLATPINFQDVTPKNNTFEVAIQVPSGVTNISNVETATITFNMKGYTETELKTENIAIINVPEGKTAELKAKSITVKVVGSAAQIAKLTGESVSCTIDLFGITEFKSLLEVPVTVTINNADSCWATGTYTSYVSVTDAEPSATPAAE